MVNPCIRAKSAVMQCSRYAQRLPGRAVRHPPAPLQSVRQICAGNARDKRAAHRYLGLVADRVPVPAADHLVRLVHLAGAAAGSACSRSGQIASSEKPPRAGRPTWSICPPARTRDRGERPDRGGVVRMSSIGIGGPREPSLEGCHHHLRAHHRGAVEPSAADRGTVIGACAVVAARSSRADAVTARGRSGRQGRGPPARGGAERAATAARATSMPPRRGRPT